MASAGNWVAWVRRVPRLCQPYVCALMLATHAQAQNSVAEFYKGKQISIVVGSSAGGGYDTYARLLARHLGKHIPGNPVIVPSNMPGAASNIAAAYIYNVAPKDGTVIGAVQTAAVLDPLFADKARLKHDSSKFIYLGSATVDYYVCIILADADVVIGAVQPAAVLDPLFADKARLKHDSSKFIYLGSATVDYYVCIIRADAAVKDFKDAQTREVIMGASQPGTSTRDFPALLNNAAGAKFRIVSGYPG